jgi:hypothetical protein
MEAFKQNRVANGFFYRNLFNNFIFSYAIVSVAFLYRFQYSIFSGRAGSGAGYDDVIYFLEGRDSLSNFHKNGFRFISEWVSSPPQSPWQRSISFLTQTLFGSNTIFLYAVNAIAITFFMYYLISLYCKNPNLKRIILSLFILSPLGSFFMFNYRPDPLYAIVTGICITKALSAHSDKNLIVLVYWLYFLFMVKPHFIAFSGATLLFCLTVIVIKLRRKILEFCKNSKNLISILPPILLLTLYLYFGWPNFYEYLRINSIGSQASWWKFGNGPFEILKMNLGALANSVGGMKLAFVTLIALVAILLRGLSVKKKFNLLSILSIGCIHFLIATFAGIPTPFFYLSAIVILFITCLEITQNVKSNSMVLEKIRTISLIIVVLYAGLNPIREWGAVEMRETNKSNQLLTDKLIKESIDDIAFAFVGPVNADSVRWEALTQNAKLKTRTIYLPDLSESSLQSFVSQSQISEVVVFLKQPMIGTNMNIPINRSQFEMMTFLIDKNSELISSIESFEDFRMIKIKK